MNPIRLLTPLLLLCGLVALGRGETYKELSDAARKDPEAAYKLGMRIIQGQIELPKEMGTAAKANARAVDLLKSAASNKHVEAQLALGFCYASGIAVPKESLVQAVEWYKKAAAQGNPEAQFKLGMCYAKGWGGLKADDGAAVGLYTKAADQGLAEAQCALGEYVLNQNAKGDYSIPYLNKYNWFLAAAKRGIPAAQLGLGKCYRDGHTPTRERDRVEALKWTLLAAASGDAKYVEELDLRKKDCAPEQIAEAERRAAAFRPE